MLEEPLRARARAERGGEQRRLAQLVRQRPQNRRLRVVAARAVGHRRLEHRPPQTRHAPANGGGVHERPGVDDEERAVRGAHVHAAPAGSGIVHRLVRAADDPNQVAGGDGGVRPHVAQGRRPKRSGFGTSRRTAAARSRRHLQGAVVQPPRAQDAPGRERRALGLDPRVAELGEREGGKRVVRRPERETVRRFLRKTRPSFEGVGRRAGSTCLRRARPVAFLHPKRTRSVGLGAGSERARRVRPRTRPALARFKLRLRRDGRQIKPGVVEFAVAPVALKRSLDRGSRPVGLLRFRRGFLLRSCFPRGSRRGEPNPRGVEPPDGPFGESTPLEVARALEGPSAVGRRLRPRQRAHVREERGGLDVR